VRKRLARSNLTPENMVVGQINLEVGLVWRDCVGWRAFRWVGCRMSRLKYQLF
jgi:hypothetical protein